ncbi:DUF3237 domain-containing protein [Roseomonas sp. OT10]|uniref:DUF3237 domain-containing protein n=1 Tax=Roseomonas cutis TaxID=2897332 RepID=UPI001E4ACCEB|nr:DUF3237 domain-containing protein [Roseomonas sp. OT10]UFN47723.1 DUF3237 domain-containing protein [Roseomonas sp. OT10]
MTERNPMDGREETGRRRLLAGSVALAAAPVAAGVQAADYAPPMAGTVPLVLPRTEFVYEAICDLEPTLMLGDSPLGERRMVPISGGSFEGPRIRGKVLPGGADRQLVRKDGVRILNALYELQAEDGAVITVHNRVLVDDPPGQPRYAFSTLEITAPEGPHGWLNRGVYVGTLNSLRPARAAVLIRVYRVI